MSFRNLSARLQYRLLMWMMRMRGRVPGWAITPLAILAALVLAPCFLLVGVMILFSGLMMFLKWRLFPPRAQRDISRLQGEDADLDSVTQTVEDEGEPLKDMHRRIVCRDPRLLPKPKPPENVWPRPRPKKVMTADEANRLFAGTMRTRNLRIRDLLADEDQLEHYGLPQWETEADVAKALGISERELWYYAIHRDADQVCHYVTFAIPKRNGEPRLIMAPKKRLKQLQRSVLDQLVSKLPVSLHAHGFLPGRSIRTGAEPHVGKKIVLTMDLKDFFPSVTFARVRGLLIAYGYSYPVATSLAVLMTESQRQPVDLNGKKVFVPVGPRHCIQGAPTSPGLCNAVALRLDHRLAGLARKYGWSYTRYADDLTFSGDDVEACRTIRRLVKQICKNEGFEINPAKTRIQRHGRRQTVTGVTVNKTLGLSRQQRRKLRAAIHQHRKHTGETSPTSFPNHLRGQLAYLHMLNLAQAHALQSRTSH